MIIDLFVTLDNDQVYLGSDEADETTWKGQLIQIVSDVVSEMRFRGSAEENISITLYER